MKPNPKTIKFEVGCCFSGESLGPCEKSSSVDSGKWEVEQGETWGEKQAKKMRGKSYF